MKDITREIIRYGHNYLDQLLSILSAPKRFFASLDLNSSESLKNPVVFYIFSLAVAFFLELPFAPKDSELWISYYTLVIFSFIATVITAGLIKLSFRMLKGQASFRSHLVYTFYITGITTIFTVIGATASKGFILSKRPDIYPYFKEYMDIYYSTLGKGFNTTSLEKFEPLFNSGLLSIAHFVFQLSIYASLIWFYFCWGSYRFINKMTKLQSFFAFSIFSTLGGPIYFFLIWLQFALKVNLF